MSMISSDVVLSKFMVKTRFRGEAGLVNVEDFVLAIVSLSLGVGADVLLFALIAIRDFTILLFARRRVVYNNAMFIYFTFVLV